MQDFSEDFIDKYSQEEFEEVEKLILMGIEDRKDGELKIWRSCFSREKFDSLNGEILINLSKDGLDGYDEEVNLTISDNCDHGNDRVEYCLEGSGLGTDSRTVPVLDDLELDFESMSTKLSKSMCQVIFDGYKPKILEIYNKQNYDNYVTGGGTNRTDNHYKDELDKYRDLGLRWNLVHKDIEVERNFN
jgi:hypothetical protein